MDKKSKVAVQIQNFLGRIAVILVAPFYFFIAKILFYRVQNLKEVRRRCADEFARHEGPWIICANHFQGSRICTDDRMCIWFYDDNATLLILKDSPKPCFTLA